MPIFSINFFKSDEFSKWLMSGQLSAKSSLKFSVSEYNDLDSILTTLTSNFNLNSSFN